MSTTQELLAILIAALILCLVFACIYKSEKLFSKLVITLILGFMLGLGYSIIKSELQKSDVTIVKVAQTVISNNLNNDIWINSNPMCNLNSPIVEREFNAILDYTSKGELNSISLSEESKCFKLRQLKVRCKDHPS